MNQETLTTIILTLLSSSGIIAGWMKYRERKSETAVKAWQSALEFMRKENEVIVNGLIKRVEGLEKELLTLRQELHDYERENAELLLKLSALEKENSGLKERLNELSQRFGVSEGERQTRNLKPTPKPKPKPKREI